jgi:hypothetical protein
MKFMLESGLGEVFDVLFKEKILSVKIVFLKNLFQMRMKIDEFDTEGK